MSDIHYAKARELTAAICRVVERDCRMSGTSLNLLLAKAGITPAKFTRFAAYHAEFALSDLLGLARANGQTLEELTLAAKAELESREVAP